MPFLGLRPSLRTTGLATSLFMIPAPSYYKFRPVLSLISGRITWVCSSKTTVLTDELNYCPWREENIKESVQDSFCWQDDKSTYKIMKKSIDLLPRQTSASISAEINRGFWPQHYVVHKTFLGTAYRFISWVHNNRRGDVFSRRFWRSYGPTRRSGPYTFTILSDKRTRTTWSYWYIDSSHSSFVVWGPMLTKQLVILL